MLGDGHSPAQIAQTLGVRISTIRSHLARSLSKTGTSRQTQLVSLIAKLGARP
jgi:DNA-binding CsgD family transcriptional regulator